MTQPDPVDPVVVPTAAEIAAAVVIPTADNEKLNKVCELTDGCEFYEGHISKLIALDDDDAEDDFEDALEDLLDIDKEDLDYDYDMKDYQVRAYSKQDKKDGNWELQVFVKITYSEDGDDDTDRIYVLITSTLDEGDYDDMVVQEVSRNFEFD